MGCDKERSRTLQLFQGSPKNNETVRRRLWPFRTSHKLYLTTLDQILVFGHCLGGHPWWYGCMCYTISATWMAG